MTTVGRAVGLPDFVLVGTSRVVLNAAMGSIIIAWRHTVSISTSSKVFGVDARSTVLSKLRRRELWVGGEAGKAGRTDLFCSCMRSLEECTVLVLSWVSQRWKELG